MHVNEDSAQPWKILAVLVVAQFMVLVDITIVNVALPSIGSALSFAPADLQWVVTAYILCSGGLLLVGGRVADRVGRRRVFLAGLTLFTAASLACGLAPSAGGLVVARAVQGVGAALLTPTALAIVTATYTGRQRATALGVWGGAASAGLGVGVLLGGMLTTWLTWRWVFLVNVPVGVATAVLALRVVPATPGSGRRRGLDLPGAAAVVAGLVALVFGVTRAPEEGWGSAQTLAPLALAAVLLAVFAVHEGRTADPLVPPRVWRVRSLISSSGLLLAITGVMAGTFFLISIYLQGALGWSALETGLGFLPFVAATGAGVHVAQHLVGGVGTRPVVVAGFLLVGAGSALLAIAPDRAGYAAEILPGLVLIGAGMGFAFPSLSITAMDEVGHEGAGLASGITSTAHELGAALGVAILAAVAAGAAGPAAGFGAGTTATAIAAVALAGGAAAVLPSVRPAPGHHVMAH